MEHVEAEKLSKHTVTKIWNVANFANYINWVTKKRSDFVGYSAGSPQPPSCSIMPNALRSGDTRV